MKGLLKQKREEWLSRQELLSWLRLGGCFVTVMLSCGIRLPGGLSPFGTAATMALPGNYTLAAFGGAMAGYAVFGSFEENLARMVALICALGLKLLVMDLPRLRQSSPFLSTAAALLMGGCLTARSLLLDLGNLDLLFCLGEAVLCGALCYFAFHGGRALVCGKLEELDPLCRMSLLLLGLTALTGICQLEVMLLNPGRILVGAILLVIGHRRGHQAALTAGVCCATAMTLSNPDLAVSGAILAAASFWAAHLAPTGRVRQGLLFLLIGMAGSLITGEPVAILDELLGTAFFLLLPDRLLELLPKPMSRILPQSDEGARMAARLRFSAETLDDIRRAVEAVSKKLYTSGICNMEQVYDRTAERVCRRCGLRLFCWETAYSQTMDAIQRFTPVLKQKGFAEKADMPAYFTGKCPRADELLQTVNSYYQEYLSREAASRKVMEAKQVASEQLEGVARMLTELGEEFVNCRSADPALTRQVENLLTEIGERPQAVWCVLDKNQRMQVELSQQTPLKNDGAAVAAQLSLLLERGFAPPCTITAGDGVRICFYEKACYRMELGACQLNAGDAPMSGDCWDSFTDSKGFFHLVLSDGMGSGGRAAVDAIMTCSFVMKLCKAGFGFDAALRLINSALLCKAGDETLATLDIACVDLYTGRMELLKAGAAASFLWRNGRTVMVGGSSLPAGILQGIQYDRHTVRLQPGDVVILLTDGAMAVNDSWMREEISLCAQGEPEAVARRLAEAARRQNGLPGDDITVTVMRLCPVD